MDGNNRNNTTQYKGKSRILRGKTKHTLLAFSAILILACIIAIPLAASSQNKTYPLLTPQANSVNPGGGGGISPGTLTRY